jgi:AraC-like DNA-binding protein
MSNKTQHFRIQPMASIIHVEAYQMRPLFSPHYSFCFLTGGELLCDIDEKRILLGPGQFLLVPENKEMFIHYFKDCTGVTGSFSMDFLKDASYPVLRSSQPIVQSFWFDDAVFMGALTKRMVTAYEDKDRAFLQSALDMILGQLRPGGHMAVVPEKFLQLVFDPEKAPLSVSEYADMLQVTANYLNKTVKAHTHRTAIDWIEIARLNLAKKLLKDPSIPIVDVALRSGLEDQSYFSRFFKKKTGLTPSQFRSGK